MLGTVYSRLAVVLVLAAVMGNCYEPAEDKLADKADAETPRFEAFYPRSAYGVPDGQSRPPHGHATFYQHRHPALVDANNAPAYGFRFDGKRRFNFD